jgi:hypothetical protein
VIGPLATNVGRIITCDACLYEWTDAGAEDVFDRFREPSGDVYRTRPPGARGDAAPEAPGSARGGFLAQCSKEPGQGWPLHLTDFWFELHAYRVRAKPYDEVAE